MNIQEIVTEFFIVSSSFILISLVKSYWPKYFEAKGTNQATKEDIGEITNIVENIKSDLLYQNELLKAQLSIENQHRLNIKNAEREAMFDFNKKISVWINTLLRFTFSIYNIDNYKDLNLNSIKWTEMAYQYDLAEAHLNLFMNDTEFIKLKRDLITKIIDFESIIDKSKREIYFAFLDLDFQLSRNDESKRLKLMNIFYTEFARLSDIFRGDIRNNYRDLAELNHQMTNLITKRLKLLEDS